MKRAVLYMRVSTRETDHPSNSLDSQQTRIKQYCLDHGIEIVDQFADLDFLVQPLKFPQLRKAVKAIYDRFLTEEPINYLVIVSPKIAPLGESSLRSELKLYGAELIIINEK